MSLEKEMCLDEQMKSPAYHEEPTDDNHKFMVNNVTPNQPKLMPKTPRSVTHTSVGPSMHSTPGKQYYTPGKMLNFAHGGHNKTPTSKLQLNNRHSATPQGQISGTPLRTYLQKTPSSSHQGTPPFYTPRGPAANPFEQDMIDRLHLPCFSPGVFAVTSTPSGSEKVCKFIF